MTPKDLKIIIKEGPFQGAPLWFFVVLFVLTLLTATLVLIRNSNKNKNQEKSGHILDNLYFFIIAVAFGTSVYFGLAYRTALINSSTGEVIATGSVFRINRIRKEIIINVDAGYRWDDGIYKPLSSESFLEEQIKEIFSEIEREEMAKKAKNINEESGLK